GTFLQAESEIAAISMVYGTSAAGKRVMTSSSSPGISLKQEGISYLAGSNLPAVIVNVQRGGPGLGGIQPSQSDYFQACKGGGHGDYHLLVLAPSTVQEMADLTFLAFDLADKYRVQSMILADGTVGQMMEPVELPEPCEHEFAKPWALKGKGEGRSKFITSLSLSPEELEQWNLNNFAKYHEIEANEQRAEEFMMDDAEICIVAFGISARVSRNAVLAAREKGIKAGMIRPITLYPFPKDVLKKAATHVKRFISVELNMGQMIEDVRLAIECASPVELCNRVGGVIVTPEEVLAAIEGGNK
ncbi:MAG: 3-methyl-2-oxobutanoate dehydrogenase subunit VorB, partial [Bacteroidales bacterium]|nr:3-methyl-2-oxobutanoate dehydrogenase subunit VorB [Bacteroidales bacterium]